MSRRRARPSLRLFPRPVRRRLLLAALLAAPTPALAQQTTGHIAGRVTDAVTGQPLGGITVTADGPQGSDATLTDEDGSYDIGSLPVGTYVVRFYAPGAGQGAERSGVVVSAERVVRANVRLSVAAGAGTETVIVRQRPAAVDVGSARTELVLRQELVRGLPLGRTFGDALALAPGAFLDGSGNVSVAGASGLENVYFVDGLNVTGLEFGDLMSPRKDASGGSNLPLDFVQELSISTGGYEAEHGGAMGGVVNVVTKSGTNEHRGSAFGTLAPSWLAGTPRQIDAAGSSLAGGDDEGFDLHVGAEVGGPILRNRLFYWLGFAPRFERSSFVRDVRARVDADGDGLDDLDEAGTPRTQRLLRTRTDQRRDAYHVGGKLTFLPAPAHRLDVSLFSTPTASRHVHDRAGTGAPALADPRTAEQQIGKTNTDVVAAWTSHLFDRRWRIDATAGLHDERYEEKSPHGALNALDQVEWHGASLHDLEGVSGCEPRTVAGKLWDPCPVDLYRGGGYGLLKRYRGARWSGDVKSTHRLSAAGSHEVKYGARLELATLDQTRGFSGPAGNRAFVQHFPGVTAVSSHFSLPRGRHPHQFTDAAPGDLDPAMNGSPAELAAPPFYKDALSAKVKSLTTSYFVQDGWSPRQDLTLNLGLRLDTQRLYDASGERFLTLHNLGLRGGFVYDHTRDGRGKIFGHYGRFFEALPLNLAARYFGGEGLLQRAYDNTSCPTPPSKWKGTGGEWAGCAPVPDAPPASASHAIFNNGANYPVQPHLRGQHHDEVVAGVQHEVLPDLVLGATFTRRWLGSVIEDGTAADGTFVLANPGRVPDEALREVEAQIRAQELALAAAGAADQATAEADLEALRSKLENLKGLAALPKPERTYTALTLTAEKRLARRWTLNASYTYARLLGNYNGLYDADNDYLAPNGSNAFDTPDLALNRRGPLANDRPHSLRLTGYYELPVGRGTFLFGAVVSAFSGAPRNHWSALFPGQQLVLLLPRGSAGRTPAVTQVDTKIAYRRPLARGVPADLEIWLDVFNLFDRRTPLEYDDNYTFEPAAAIVNGKPSDLPHAKNAAGDPVTVNPNFGRPVSYQAPIHGRLGLRILF